MYETAAFFVEGAQFVTWRLLEMSLGAAIVVGWLALLGRCLHLKSAERCWLWRAAYGKLLLLLVPGVIAVPYSRILIETVGPANHARWTSSNPTIETANHSDLIELRLPKTTPTHALKSHRMGWGVAWWLIGPALWIAGVAGRAVRTYRLTLCVGELRRRSLPLTDPQWLTIWRNESSERARRALPLRVVDEPSLGPMLVGGTRSMILIPKSLVGTAAEPEIRCLLRHELAHWQRGDLHWNWLAMLVDSVFFFHPCVWWLHRLAELDQEIACDQWALRGSSGPRRAYMELLLRLALAPGPRWTPTVARATGDRSFLRERFTAMLTNEKRQWGGGIMGQAIAVLAVSVMLVPWTLRADEKKVYKTEVGSARTVRSSRGASSASATSDATGQSGGMRAGRGYATTSVWSSNDSSSSPGSSGEYGSSRSSERSGGGGSTRGFGGGSSTTRSYSSSAASGGSSSSSSSNSSSPAGGGLGYPSTGSQFDDREALSRSFESSSDDGKTTAVTINRQRQGAKVLTTIQEDEITIVITERPRRLLVTIVRPAGDESSDETVERYGAASPEELSEKAPQAYLYYQKYVVQQNELATQPGGMPNDAAQMQRKMLEQMLREAESPELRESLQKALDALGADAPTRP